MLLLMSTWTSGTGECSDVAWALASLSIETIQKYLARIAMAEKLYEQEGADFFCIKYWDGLTVWEGYCEIWEDVYQESVQIIEGLQPGQHSNVATECTFLEVTHEGICWETSLKDSLGTAGTDLVTKAMLLELLLQQQALAEYKDAVHSYTYNI